MDNALLKNEIKNSVMTSLVDKGVVSDEKYRPRLLVNNAKSGLKILTTLQDELKDCDEFAISVAFINTKAVEIGWQLENPVDDNIYEYFVK